MFSAHAGSDCGHLKANKKKNIIDTFFSAHKFDMKNYCQFHMYQIYLGLKPHVIEQEKSSK